MKNPLMFSFFILFAIYSFGQNKNFPDSNAVWSIYDQKYFVNGDSIVNGVSYKKYFFSNSPTLTNSSFYTLLREDTILKQIVTRSNTGQERLLYDFSVGTNDVLTVFPMPFMFVPIYGDSIRIKVESVDSIAILGQYHKRMKMVGVDMITNMEEYWIEGIGSTMGIFNAGLTGFVAFDVYYPTLICFEKNGILSFQNSNFTGCFSVYPTGIEEELNSFEIKAYPNPVNEILNITNAAQISTYQIFQYDGKLIRQGNTFPVNISEYPKGLYFIIAKTKDNRVMNQKIIKQ